MLISSYIGVITEFASTWRCPINSYNVRVSSVMVSWSIFPSCSTVVGHWDERPCTKPHVIFPFFFFLLTVGWMMPLSDAHRTSGHILLIWNFLKKENISPACCRVAGKFPRITYLSLHWLGVRYWMCNLGEQSVQKRNLTGREKVSQQEHTSASRAKRKHWTVVRSAKIPHPIVLNMDAHNSHVSETTWLNLVSLSPIDVLP